jgi:Kef-type K+ transport system membrane component KefB
MRSLDIQLLLVDVALVIVLARLLGAAARRLGQPPVLGEILAGILLGPTLFHGRITATLFPPNLIAPLTALADLGLVLFIFVVGYKLDMRLIRGRERVAMAVSLGSVAVPLALGAGLGLWLAHRNHVHHVAIFALFIGTAMAATAFPVLARILADGGLLRCPIGGLALASAAATDVLAWSLLAVVVALAAGGSGQSWRVLLAPVYAAVMFLLVRPWLRRLSRVYARAGQLTPNILAPVLAGLMLSCYATSWMGLHFIAGAFLFGIVMPRDEASALREDILGRLDQVSVLVLLPLYFVVSGLSINLADMGSSGLEELGAILAVAIIGKLSGTYLGARLGGVRGRDASVLAVLMNTRGLTELVILGVGLQLHILDRSLYSLMVIMALATTAMSGPLLKLIYPDRLRQRDLANADRALLAGRRAHRILVPIDRPETAADVPGQAPTA